MKMCIFQWGDVFAEAEVEINKLLSTGIKVVHLMQSSCPHQSRLDESPKMANCLTVWYEDVEQSKDEELLSDSLEILELSARPYACLVRNAGIKTLKELCSHTERELLKYRNFGNWSLNEVKEKLAKIGLHLGMVFPSI